MRIWKTSAANVAMLAVAGVALLSVAALARQAWTAWDSQRQATERMRMNIAVIAARNYASRLQAIVAMHAAGVTEPLHFESGDVALRRRVRAIADSLASCHCQSRLVVDALLLADSGGRLLARDAVDRGTPIAYGASVPAGQRALARAADEPVLSYSAPAALTAVRRIPQPQGAGWRFAVVVYRPGVLGESFLSYVHDSLGRLVPVVLTGQASEQGAVSLTVRAGGITAFQSQPGFGDEVRHSVPLHSDSSIVISASTNPQLTMPSLAVATNRAMVVGALTLATVLAVLATTLLALRSAQLARLRGEFTAAVTHELRTPLTEIILFAELVESGRAQGGDAVRDAARLIRAEARRLHQMVENVLHVSRNGAGGFGLSPRRQRVQRLVQDVIDGFAPIATQRGASVVLEPHGDPELVVDPSALRQVLLNLLDNAVRYGPDDQTVVVRLREHAPTAQIEVDDAGPGIAPADRARVVLPYVRLARDVERARTGTGLGLSVVQQLVTSMRGRMELRDSARGGTCVSLTLPCLVAPPA